MNNKKLVDILLHLHDRICTLEREAHDSLIGCQLYSQSSIDQKKDIFYKKLEDLFQSDDN